MSPQDPKTRHLSRSELMSLLADRDAVPRSESVEPKTTFWSRDVLITPAKPAAEPVTQLEVFVGSKSKVKSHSEQGKVDTDRCVATKSPTSIVTRIGIGVLVAAIGWWVGLRPPPPSAVLADPSRSAATIQAEVASPKVSPSAVAVPIVPADTPSPRLAVDLLIAGREREALDAYRALSLAAPQQASFAVMVRQLERELTECEKEPGTCAR